MSVALVALATVVVSFAPGTIVAEARNGVAAINPESTAAVEPAGNIAAAQVGSDAGMFDDGVSGCCVAPEGHLPARRTTF